MSNPYQIDSGNSRPSKSSSNSTLKQSVKPDLVVGRPKPKVGKQPAASIQMTNVVKRAYIGFAMLPILIPIYIVKGLKRLPYFIHNKHEKYSPSIDAWLNKRIDHD